jgi:histone-lysine N-methyltransferase SETMAR
MWALAKDDVARQTRTDIQSKKFMFTIMWNPDGFHVIGWLPTGPKISGAYYITNILQPLHSPFFPQGRGSHGKGLAVHVTCCSVHRSITTESFMKTRDMVLMPHPPYSPDLAPSDPSLFPTVRERFEHAGLTDKNQLFEEFQMILMSAPG